MSGETREILYAKRFSFLTLAGDATRSRLHLSHSQREFIGGFKGCLEDWQHLRKCPHLSGSGVVNRNPTMREIREALGWV